MSRRSRAFLKAALSALHYSGADRMLAPMTRGVGVIFTLHRVRPATEGFGPNRILEISPEFLDETIRLVLDRGFEVLSLDDVHARLVEGDFDRPFACFTFDDGYRDNREFAYPIFRRYRLPMAVYVPTDFADGFGDLWWLKLEMALAALERLSINLGGSRHELPLETVEQKDYAFEQIYWSLRDMAERDARRLVDELCSSHGVATDTLCRDLIMDWDEVRDLAKDPLVTIGAHTRAHYALAKLHYAEARLEIEASVSRLEREIGKPVRHFSYPYGDEASAGEREFAMVRELGLATAVTTRKGLIRSRHSSTPTALPRVSLNGEFQNSRYVKVMLSGAPFAFWNMARGLRPAA
ncbi:MAG: polysaccharide deacetylase family protein [Proteobacteria bacterium]|nr:polysaccharide deacetylase family protein [Pseudomonadota bacterium]